MAATDLHFLTLAEASRLIADRKLSPVELTEAYLDRIAALDSQLDSFVTLTPERARADARTAEAEIASHGPRGPMHGIPYCLKDIFDTAGIRTTAMSKLLADNVPARDSACGEKLTTAGGVLLGKNATWEFAHGGPSWDVLFPPARNAWNRDHSPAGSSSGSGAAVAAGFSPATLGSDTGGSIRGPAAANGIAGLKPTYGLVSRRGVIPNCFSHDHAGPLAWTVEDVAILMSIIAGHDPEDPASANVPVADFRAALTGDVKGLVIGVPWGWFEELPLSPATMAAFEATLDVYKHLGAEVRPVTLPPLHDFDHAKKVIAVAELFTIHAQDLRTRPALFGDSLRYRIIAGGLVRAEEYILAMRQRTDLARAMQAVMATVDVLMMPTQEPAGKLEPVAPETLFTKTSFTTPFNVGGNPALAMCNGYAENGLPFSLQITGKLFDDATVLRVGDAYERVTPWRQPRPELVAA
ncbi:amidase [Rhodopila sp.]|uniref:amidase n=1 Tax=Rhodopila sp. TaxID=2480087 RepID=UPI003D0C45DC